MTVPHETLAFDTRHVGRRVLVYDAVVSTNDVAAALAADPANAGGVVVAGNQTAGRGQYGRAWQSRSGQSLLASVLVFPPPAACRPVVLTAWATVAVGEVIQMLTGADARVKWPNDLLVGGKKVCGVLIEQAVGTVAGVGLNLNQTADDFAAAGLPDAASLGMVVGSRIDPADALGVFVRSLDAWYGQLLDGDFGPLEAEWSRRLGLVGRVAAVELTDGTDRVGRVRGVGFGGLEITNAGGSADVIAPESVRHVRGA